MIDATLACEDAYSKLVKVVTVSGVSDEDRVGKSLLQIWKLSLFIKLNFVQTLTTRFGQDFEVEVQARFKLKFGQYFAVGVWLRLRS